jgi:hypothetical protein
MERALGWLIYSLTQTDRAPEGEKLGRLLEGLKANPSQRRTLGGVSIARKGGEFLFKLAPVRRGQMAIQNPTPQSQYARLFGISRQPHEFVTQ